MDGFFWKNPTKKAGLIDALLRKLHIIQDYYINLC